MSLRHTAIANSVSYLLFSQHHCYGQRRMYSASMTLGGSTGVRESSHMCMGVAINRQFNMIWRYVCGMDICDVPSQLPSLLWTTGKREEIMRGRCSTTNGKDGRETYDRMNPHWRYTRWNRVQVCRQLTRIPNSNAFSPTGHVAPEEDELASNWRGDGAVGFWPRITPNRSE